MRRLRGATALLFLSGFLALGGGAAGKTFGGIGAAVVPVASGELVIVKVVAGSPAAEAGLLPGDLLVEVDGEPLKGSTFPEVARRHLWGPVGSRVELLYRRPGREGTHKLLLPRVALDPEGGRTPGVELILPDAKSQEDR